MADKKISDGTLRGISTLEAADVFEIEKTGTAVQYKTQLSDIVAFSALNNLERSSDPSDPAEGAWVIWMSDGTASGADGDILIKITAGGVTKTITLIDFSVVP